MGLTERKQRQQQELKERIIQSSREIVENEGWAALSIRKIADAIEYSVPVIYKHFENKEAIASYFVIEGFEILEAKIVAEVNREENAASQIKSMATAYWCFAVENPKHYEIMFGLGIPSCEMTVESMEIKAVSDSMLAIIDTAIAESGKKGIDRYLKLRTLWSILHGIVALELLQVENRPNVCPSEVLKDAMDGYVKSILL
ncbi:TetR/AcrR family transcriptional regulator [Sphingobacterium lactis]|uniref:TetR/AcrR family transcriptional regulator n=1 Tax=Sphingobacterium lactis TaxID=797291 RepID=UPI003DA216DC